MMPTRSARMSRRSVRNVSQPHASDWSSSICTTRVVAVLDRGRVAHPLGGLALAVDEAVARVAGELVRRRGRRRGRRSAAAARAPDRRPRRAAAPSRPGRRARTGASPPRPRARCARPRRRCVRRRSRLDPRRRWPAGRSRASPATCRSIASRLPVATTARPSVCTCSISRSAFSRGIAEVAAEDVAHVGHEVHGVVPHDRAPGHARPTTHRRRCRCRAARGRRGHASSLTRCAPARTPSASADCRRPRRIHERHEHDRDDHEQEPRHELRRRHELPAVELVGVEPGARPRARCSRPAR